MFSTTTLRLLENGMRLPKVVSHHITLMLEKCPAFKYALMEAIDEFFHIG
jgi:hypothetical protein